MHRWLNSMRLTGSTGRADVSHYEKQCLKQPSESKSLLGDLVSYGDIVMLITPIDTEAPEGQAYSSAGSGHP